MSGVSVVRRSLALILGMALLLVAVVGLVEITWAALGRRPWIVSSGDWANWLGAHHWSDAPVCVGLAVLLLLGLVVLWSGLRRGRPSNLPLTSTEPDITIAVSRRSLERLLDGAACSTPGVTSADVKARRASVRINAWTSVRDHGDLHEQVTATVQNRLADLGLSKPLRPTVRVRTKDSR